MFEYAGVYILDNPYFLDRVYDYFLPSTLRDSVCVGGFVTVPFGTANRRRMALVVSLSHAPATQGLDCKPILSTCHHKLTLSEEQLALCFFMKEQMLCTVGDAVRAIIPASVLSGLTEVYRFCGEEELPDNLNETTLLICQYLRKKGSVRFDLLKNKFGPELEGALRQLRERGLVIRDFEIFEKEEKTVNYYTVALPREDLYAIIDGTDKTYRLRAPQYALLLQAILGCEEAFGMAEADLLACDDGATTAHLNMLCRKGILHRTAVAQDRSELKNCVSTPRPITLNEEQANALQTLEALLDTHEPRAALLHGVTGSGKTCVMLKLIDRVLSENRSVIVLLPEIALTPQTLGIFCSRYGDRVAVIHSALSPGERYDTYNKIREGKADVVIGTRSAVFAPVQNLGVIIIDEEQEHTYKSDMNPKYHAKDIARYRCYQSHALMLLASATPSLESYHKAMEGAYTLITMKKRYGNAVLPVTTVSDMRREAQAGNTSPLGALLCRKLVENHKAGGQSVLFLNRRGYNRFLSCRDCGEAIKCPDCSVSMTYHTFGKSYDRGELRCHWCGKRQPMPQVCPSCGGAHLVRMGYGTQRVEQELAALLPDARILRMDTDTTSSRYSYEEMLGKFRRHEADILLGTQMVTKGHDFPDVTLVGVLLADSSLYLDDYRAEERTFAMLTQVIGRAGRADKPGEAIIQTNNPHHDCIRLACAQDYETFYQREIGLRRALVFPPFCDVALFTLTGTVESELLLAATKLATLLQKLQKEEFSEVPLVSFGPFEAPVYKVENRYRMRMVIKCRLRKDSRALFCRVMAEFSKFATKGISLSVDLNPSNI